MSEKASSRNMSSSAQLRKIKKPIIEKKRRERINECLNELKTLVLDALNKDESRYNKMEKADILEMTVRHLRTSHTTPTRAATQPADLATKYVAGFHECAQEVSHYLGSMEGLSPEVRHRLMQHLSHSMQTRSTSPEAPQAVASLPNTPSATPLSMLPGVTLSQLPANAMPVTLPSGVIAFLPTNSPMTSSPQLSPVDLKSAIPLYVNTPSSSPPAFHQQRQQSPAPSVERYHNNNLGCSPKLGDDVPAMFSESHHYQDVARHNMESPPTSQTPIDYRQKSVIVKSPQPQAPVVIKSEPMYQHAIHCGQKIMWRPW